MKLQAPSTLLMGPSGSGKTSSLATFAKAGIETFCIFTEPNGPESFVDSIKRLGADMNLCHWASVLPAPAGWGALRQMATTVKAMDYEAISRIKAGVEKGAMDSIPRLLYCLENFTCERTGKSYGDVTTWDAKRAFCLDSLSGLSLMTWLMTVGYKPSAHQGEWGVAMNFIEQLILKLTADVRCFFVLTTHIEREVDELSGASKIMASTLGRKLAPKLPRFFSDVVLCARKGDGTFSWSTTDAMADLKNRALPISSTIQPDFSQIVRTYQSRVTQVEGSDSRTLPSTSSTVAA